VVKVNNVAAVYIAKALHGKKFFNFRNAKGAEEGLFCIQTIYPAVTRVGFNAEYLYGRNPQNFLHAGDPDRFM
jgi:hypothetical protein